MNLNRNYNLAKNLGISALFLAAQFAGAQDAVPQAAATAEDLTKINYAMDTLWVFLPHV